MPNRPHWLLLALALPLAAARGQAADAETLPPADERRAEADEHKRYFLIAPRAKKPPKEGCALLLVLPGGDGSAEFKAFVQRIAANATDDDWVVAHLVAPQWTPEQAKNLVWPTAKNPAAAMKFSTEQFLAAVIRDVEQVHPIDPARVFTLSWSSGGPAAYAASLDPAIGITGSFVAMSVWKPDQLPPLKAAKDHPYYVLHSPQDFISIRMAEQAVADLAKAGARTELQQYEGGHGWHGDMFGMLRKGLAWLDEHHAAPSKQRLDERKKAKAAAGKPGKPAKPAK